MARRRESTEGTGPQLELGLGDDAPLGKRTERLPLKRLTVAELDAKIRELEKKIAPTQREISRLKRARAAKIAGKLSGPGRMRGDPAGIQARWLELEGSPNAIKTIAGEFKCSVRTVHRKLGKIDTRPRPSSHGEARR